MNAFQTMTLYLENLNFLIESIDKIKINKDGKVLKKIKKLYKVPSFTKILCNFLIYLKSK